MEIAKGTKDWFGSEAILRDTIRKELKEIYRRYGFNIIETPPYENLDTLTSKGGGEIQKEVFQFSDQGGRKLGLRFDQTVPFARFLATHQNELSLPFKRFVIGESYRDGPTQVEQGRYRVFTQCDVDVVGVQSMAAEAELMSLAGDVFSATNLGDVDIKINNRKLLDGLLQYVGIPRDASTDVIVALDKLDKKSESEVIDEIKSIREFMTPVTLTNDQADSLIEAFNQGSVEDLRNSFVPRIGNYGWEALVKDLESVNSNNVRTFAYTFETKGIPLVQDDSVNRLFDILTDATQNYDSILKLQQLDSNDTMQNGLQELKDLFHYANEAGNDFITFDPSLARGLNYYTGTTLEIFLKDRNICKSAIGGGGRFDNMVGDFMGSEETIPAVGFSFGLERVCMAVQDKLKQENKSIPNTRTQLYLTNIGQEDAMVNIASKLRRAGVSVETDKLGQRIKKNFKYANREGFPFVGVIGDDEINNNSVAIKNMDSGKQELVPIEDISDYIAKENPYDSRWY